MNNIILILFLLASTLITAIVCIKAINIYKKNYKVVGITFIIITTFLLIYSIMIFFNNFKL